MGNLVGGSFTVAHKLGLVEDVLGRGGGSSLSGTPQDRVGRPALPRGRARLLRERGVCEAVQKRGMAGPLSRPFVRISATGV